MKSEILLSMTYVTVSDIVDVHTGDISFDIHIHCEKFEEYLKVYGRKGKNKIVVALGNLICEVEKRFNELESKGETK